MHLDLLRDKNRTFPAPADPEGVSSLRVWHCKYATLAALAGFKHLEELTIAGFPDESLAMLAPLGKLRYLRVIDLGAIADLDDLGAVTSLESLSLATLPSWDASGRTHPIASLEPLTRLPRLRHLELFGVLPADRSLAPLKRCPGLASLRVSRYPAAEVEAFYAATGVTNAFNPPPAYEG